LIEQETDLRVIVDIAGRQLRCNDPVRIGIHSDMQLAP